MSNFRSLKFEAYSLALLALVSTFGCDTPPSGTCDDDERPREFCSDIHAEFNLTPTDWMCIAQDCDYPIVTEDGCVRIKEALDKGIPQTHECIVEDPSVEATSSSAGSGGWDDASDASDSTSSMGSSTGSSSTSGATTSDSVGSSEGSGESTTTSGSESEGSESDSASTESTDTAGDTTSSESDSSSSSEGTSDTGSVCEDEMCKNGGSCVDDVCACINGFDPATDCEDCEPGLVLHGDRCIVDPCESDPCNLDEHGLSCEIGSDGDAACTCHGDFTAASNCTKCPDGQEPDTGHDCKPSDLCDDVTCGSGASCDGTDGTCSCDSPNTWPNNQQDCVNPCDADPCNIVEGHGRECRPLSAVDFTCLCNGGHTPSSNCASCPAGKMTHDGQCVDECSDQCFAGQRECKSSTVSQYCEKSGACWRWKSESCGNGICQTADGICGPPPGMVFIPGGNFTLTGGGTVEVQDNFMDILEVSVRQYQDCVNDGACNPAGRALGCNVINPGSDTHPINCVDWSDAQNYCDWVDKTLPTSWQWQWAAVGRSENRTYPWGEQAPSCGRVLFAEKGAGSGCDDIIGTWPVGSKPAGASRDGVLNMGGNIAEWAHEGAGGGQAYALGGYFVGPPEMTRGRYREIFDDGSAGHRVGFRCSLSYK